MKAPRKGKQIIWRQVRNRGNWASTKNGFVNKIRWNKNRIVWNAYRKKTSRRESLERQIGSRLNLRRQR